MTATEEALADLERRRKARLGKKGYEQNVEAIDAQIARLRRIIAEGEG